MLIIKKILLGQSYYVFVTTTRKREVMRDIALQK